MSDYLTEFEIDSSATLASDGFEVVASSGAYRATIKQISAEPVGRSARLRLQLFHSAVDFAAAESAAGGYAVELAELLTFCTSSRFERPELTRQIDWSDGLVHRQAAIYTKVGEFAGPDPVLDSGVAETVSALVRTNSSGHLRRATFWYREGIKALGPDAKVQAFWLCLETLISGSKATEPVTDRCVFCQGDLACGACGRVSEHMPFAPQRIKLLLRERLRDDDSVYGRASKARNHIMHGGTLVAQPSKKAWDLGIVNDLGDAAWQCLVHELGASIGPGKAMRLWKPSTYLSSMLRIMTKVWIVVPLIGGKPDPDSIPTLDVTVVHQDGAYLLKQQATGGVIDLGEALQQTSNADG